MKMTLIAVGKLKTAHWLAAQKDYVGRLRHYVDLDIIEIRDQTAEKEAADILRAAADSPALIALTPEGKLLDSVKWSETLQQWGETYQRLAFVIGGPAGLAPEVLKKSRFQLALSPMTFTHEMARVLFLEQLYRACTILKGEKYHK